MDKLKTKHIIPYLPYKLKVISYGKIYNVDGVDINENIIDFDFDYLSFKAIKPILRSFDSLSAVEIKEIFPHYYKHGKDYLKEEVTTRQIDVITFNRLLKRHIDVFNLITFGLAEEK